MRTFRLLWLLALGLLLSGCGGNVSSTPAAPDSPGPRVVQDCPPPGPAPGMPNWLQHGRFLNYHHGLVASYDLVTGPFLRNDDHGCPQWAFGGLLTVHFTHGDRFFWESGTVGIINSKTTFHEDPTPDCAHPSATVTLVPILDSGGNSTGGYWGFTDRGCDGHGFIRFQRGPYTVDHP